MDQKRWIDVSFGAVGVLSFFLSKQIIELVWDYFRLPLYENFVVTLPVLIAIIAGVTVFFVLKKNNKAVQFVAEVLAELVKVTWPVKKETLVSSVVVVVMVGIASVVLFLFDSIWGTVTKRFLAL